DVATQARFNVGGVLLDRPFKVRRLCHFGLNAYRMSDALHFYNDLLGFRIVDIQDPARGGGTVPEEWKAFGDLNGYFFRYAHDHHAFVLYNHRLRGALDTKGRFRPEVTINQITWQVQSLAETVAGHDWFVARGEDVVRNGRDMPGSNWHTYVLDPDGHTNELYYGIEQVGWEGYSKPRSLYHRGFQAPPELPQIAEIEEIQQELAKGTDLHAGYHQHDDLPATFDVDGILLPRPFKVVRIGPVSLFVANVAAATAFYRDRLGFTVTAEIDWHGYPCTFLRANTEHHALALLPVQIRPMLGLNPQTTCAAFGMQVANYRQLREAVQFLTDRGCRLLDSVPPDLYPGIDYAAHVLDPDGHCIQLYYYMQQVPGNGHAPAPLDRSANGANPATWPETVEAHPDTFAGEPFLGPWG
ncbi:MAG TPA: VOC family protein, partial [Dehalococcoidia bacterium]|nr:VOC family protein [Dehalococcoidia bacterium]